MYRAMLSALAEHMRCTLLKKMVKNGTAVLRAASEQLARCEEFEIDLLPLH